MQGAIEAEGSPACVPVAPRSPRSGEVEAYGLNQWHSRRPGPASFRAGVGRVVVADPEGDPRCGLGVNPMSDGQLVRVPIPELSQERRQELGKIAHKYAEQARVAVRNVRRDGMDALKKLEKDHKISQDEHRQRSDEVQKATDLHIKLIDDALAAKEKEIMHV
jgi:hypothetical protein